MILNHLNLSKETIIDNIEELGYTKIPDTVMKDLGKYLVDFGKDFMKHQFEVDLVDPKTGEVTVNLTRAKVMKFIWSNLTFRVKDNELEVLLNKRVTGNSSILKQVMDSEYGSSGTKPYPLFRKFVYFVEKNERLVIKQFILERGM